MGWTKLDWNEMKERNKERQIIEGERINENHWRAIIRAEKSTLLIGWLSAEFSFFWTRNENSPTNRKREKRKPAMNDWIPFKTRNVLPSLLAYWPWEFSLKTTNQQRFFFLFSFPFSNIFFPFLFDLFSCCCCLRCVCLSSFLPPPPFPSFFLFHFVFCFFFIDLISKKIWNWEEKFNIIVISVSGAFGDFNNFCILEFSFGSLIFEFL
jgi:hypothetical protein